MTALLGGKTGTASKRHSTGISPTTAIVAACRSSLASGPTQTGRVLAHRERSGGFKSADELDEIPGFPADFLAQIKSRLTT